MRMTSPILDEFFDLYESQYVRDFDGRLIQIRPATQKDLQTVITVTIDGQEIKVPKATPATDDQGSLLRDKQGMLVPRLTTIYDAAVRLFVTPADAAQAVPTSSNPIPVLCHQSHVKPVGMCRVCCVLTSKKGKAGTRLVPACHHPAVDRMEVHTVASRKEVLFPGETEPRPAGRACRAHRTSLDRAPGGAASSHTRSRRPSRYVNELWELRQRFGVPVETSGNGLLPQTPFLRRTYDGGRTDRSSPVIAVDHNQCILCDRCVRACSEVKPFRIIGHTGFGHAARVSFDLGSPMVDSGCVSCGECAVSCPTGALTFKGTIYEDRDPWADHAGHKPVTVPAEELAIMPLFRGVPYAYLKWNEGAVGRLHCAAGQILCREGEYGSTWFVIEAGAVDVLKRDRPVACLSPADVIVGEMACMKHQPRTATLRAQKGATVLVARRNILHVLQRNRLARLILYPAYRKRALNTYREKGDLFAGLDEKLSRQAFQLLQDHDSGVRYSEADPGQIIVRQGDEADSFYIVNLGHVEVREKNEFGHEIVRTYLGPGRQFGEIALISALFDDVAAALPPEQRGRRTATCIALDHVELVRIDRTAFEAVLSQQPEIGKILREKSLKMIREGRRERIPVGPRMADFTAAGLFQGQNLLVLDLTRCNAPPRVRQGMRNRTAASPGSSSRASGTASISFPAPVARVTTRSVSSAALSMPSIAVRRTRSTGTCTALQS